MQRPENSWLGWAGCCSFGDEFKKARWAAGAALASLLSSLSDHPVVTRAVRLACVFVTVLQTRTLIVFDLLCNNRL